MLPESPIHSHSSGSQSRDWLTKRSGRRTFEKIWRPLLRAKLGERYREASAAFLWAIIVRLYAARRAGLGSERFGYVPGGYARILDALGARLHALGVEFVLDAPVERVFSEGGAIAVDTAGGSHRTFERVVVTAAATRAAKLCAELNAAERASLDSKRYQGIVCASLLIDQPLGPFYVTNLTDAWVPFSAVIEMSALVDRRHFAGGSLVYLPKYAAPDDPVFARDDAALEAEYCSALARMYPRFDRRAVRAFRVSRVREVFPITTLDYSRTLPPIATSVPGLYLANSAHIVNGTLNVNETVGLAERVFLQLAAELEARTV